MNTSKTGSIVLPGPFHSFAEMLSKAQATQSKKEKREIISNALSVMAYSKEVSYLLVCALSPYLKYYIAKIDIPEGNDNVLEDQNKAWSIARMLLVDLAERKVTGNAARDAVKEVLSLIDGRNLCGVSPREAFARIIKKDLKAGFSESTVNKVSENLIPVFKCQLAPFDIPEIDSLSLPLIIEPKFDGVRAIAINSGNDVKIFSRSGEVFENFREINAMLKNLPENIVLDGEIVHAEIRGEAGYQLILKRAIADAGVREDIPVLFSVFDTMYSTEFTSGECSLLQGDRKARLKEIINLVRQSSKIENPPIIECPSLVCTTHESIKFHLSKFIEDGYEGAMVKKIDAPYEFKRCKNWQKLKEFFDLDMTVIDIAEGSGKYAGMMGAILCECNNVTIDDKKYKKILTEVGSGFTDDLRKEVYENKEQWIGATVEIKYQNITLAENSSDYSLRFPVFKRLRSLSGRSKI